MTNEPKPRLKLGKPIGSKDTIPRKRKSVISMTPEEHITIKPKFDEQVTPAEAPVKELSLNDVLVHNNEEISINYIHEGRIWDRNQFLCPIPSSGLHKLLILYQSYADC